MLRNIIVTVLASFLKLQLKVSIYAEQLLLLHHIYLSMSITIIISRNVIF